MTYAYRSGDVIMFDGEAVARLHPKALPTLVDRFCEHITEVGAAKENMAPDVRAAHVKSVLDILGEKAEAGLVTLDEVQQALEATL